MVSIVVGDCDPEIDLLTLDSLYCEDVTVTSTTASTVTMTKKSINTTQASTLKISNSDEIIIINGVVAFSFLLLIICLVVFTFVIKRRRKSATVNTFDPIEMSTQPQMLHNTSSESIMDANQASTTQLQEEVKHDEAVDCIEMDANQAYIKHSETKGAGKKGCIEMDANQAYGTDTLPTDPNVAYGTTDCIEMDANQAYGINTVPTSPNVAYNTHPLQIHDYELIYCSSLNSHSVSCIVHNS